jgi:hypothetical protein
MSKHKTAPKPAPDAERQRLEAEALRLILREASVTQYHIWIDSRVEPCDPHFAIVREIIEELTRKNAP